MSIKNNILAAIFISLGTILCSCNFFHNNETVYEFSNGNKIVFDKGLFGDITVLYETVNGTTATLFYYRYADDNERIYDSGLKGSDDGTLFAALISESTNQKDYPNGTCLYMYKMDFSDGVKIFKSKSVTDVKVTALTSVTNESVTYVTDSGIVVSSVTEW